MFYTVPRLNIARLPALVTNALVFTQWNSNACVYDANFIHKLPEFVYKVKICDKSHAPKMIIKIYYMNQYFVFSIYRSEIFSCIYYKDHVIK